MADLVHCPDCRGAGYVELGCDNCNGTGRQECPVCYGYGEVQAEILEPNVRCPACHGSGKDTSCDRCQGKGSLPGEACFRCNGAGKITFEEFKAIQARIKAANQRQAEKEEKKREEERIQWEADAPRREAEKKRIDEETRNREAERVELQRRMQAQWEAEAPLREAEAARLKSRQEEQSRRVIQIAEWQIAYQQEKTRSAMATRVFWITFLLLFIFVVFPFLRTEPTDGFKLLMSNVLLFYGWLFAIPGVIVAPFIVSSVARSYRCRRIQEQINRELKKPI